MVASFTAYLTTPQSYF